MLIHFLCIFHAFLRGTSWGLVIMWRNSPQVGFQERPLLVLTSKFKCLLFLSLSNFGLRWRGIRLNASVSVPRLYICFYGCLRPVQASPNLKEQTDPMAAWTLRAPGQRNDRVGRYCTFSLFENGIVFFEDGSESSLFVFWVSRNLYIKPNSKIYLSYQENIFITGLCMKINILPQQPIIAWINIKSCTQAILTFHSHPRPDKRSLMAIVLHDHNVHNRFKSNCSCCEINWMIYSHDKTLQMF